MNSLETLGIVFITVGIAVMLIAMIAMFVADLFMGTRREKAITDRIWMYASPVIAGGAALALIGLAIYAGAVRD